MLKYIWYLILGLGAITASAQSTTVSGTLVDPLGNTWSAATITAVFQNTPGKSPPFVWTGGAFNQLPATVTSDSGGNFSLILPSNTSISPVGSTWLFSVCPNASLQCAVVNVAVSGTTLNIVPIITGANAWPPLPAQPTTISKVYNTNQVAAPPQNQGGMLYDTTSQEMLVFTAGGWEPFATVGGLPIITNPAGTQNIIQPLGSFLEVNGQPVSTMQSFNVKYYGAVGDGVTDDSAAINKAIVALDAAGAGRLYFPVGNYFSANCGFIIGVPVILEGDGVTDQTLGTFSSNVVCGSSTAVLFTVTSNSGLFQNISLTNTASTTPTAGAAVFTNSTLDIQRINLQNVQVNGFYDDIHVGVGSRWTMKDSELDNPVRRALWIQNTVDSDAGDWTVSGNEFAAGARTEAVGSAAVYQDSSGGGKWISNKVNSNGGGNFEHGLVLNLSGSVQGQYSLNNIETTSKEPIYITNAWPWLTFTDNMLIAPAGYADITATNGLNNVYIGGGTMNGLGTTSYSVNLQGTLIDVTVMPFSSNNWTVSPTNMATSTPGPDSQGDINNTLLNASAFNGLTVTATTALFTSGIIVGTTGGGGEIEWIGQGAGSTWAASTVGGTGLHFLSSAGATVDFDDNSMFNIGHGPYAIGGVQITTLALSDGPLVMKSCGTITTTTAAMDALSCSFVTPISTCSVTRANSIDAAFTFYTVSTGGVAISHGAVAGATYGVSCSVN